MPLKILCDTCDRELNEPAALVFLPPNHVGDCTKLHICTSCLPSVMLALTELRHDNDLV